MEQDTNNQVFKEARKVLTTVCSILFTEHDRKNIYHYTSPLGLEGILSSGKLWFTKSDYLNDISELRYIFESLEGEIDRGNYNKEFCQHIRSEFIKDKNMNSSILNCDYYICSFSKIKDGLSLWNYYTKSKSKAGYNIEINSLQLMEDLKESSKNVVFNMGDVIYARDDHAKLWSKVLSHLNQVYVDNINLCSSKSMELTSIDNVLIDVIMMYAPFIKHPAFKDEEERRIVCKIYRDTPTKIKIREQHGIFVPYLELAFDKSLIESVIISPYVQCDAKIKSIHMLAEEYNLNIKCIASQIPIRF